MTISIRARKILWGRSGGLCAICGRRLTADKTEADPTVVLGEECHIVARQPGGPRGGELPEQGLDSYENLILLCRDDHRRVDEQPGRYTAERLEEIKTQHERRVRDALNPTPDLGVRFRDARNPPPLRLLRGGKAVWDLVTSALAYQFDHPDLEGETEADLVGEFLDLLKDWGDIHNDVSSRDQLSAQVDIGDRLTELEEGGFVVYGAASSMTVEVAGQTMPWRTAVIVVVRRDDPRIVDESKVQSASTDDCAG